MAELRDELMDLIADEALIERSKLVPEATLADLGLDSVGVVSVVFAVEEKYGVEIAEDAFKDVTDFAAFLAVLESVVETKRAA
jgi:acyl carrier protein